MPADERVQKAVDGLWSAYFALWKHGSDAWDTLDEMERVLSQQTGLSEKAISERGAASRGQRHGSRMLTERKTLTAERDLLRALLVKFRDESSPMNGEGNGLECAWHGGPCKDGRDPNGREACTACKIRVVIGETPA